MTFFHFYIICRFLPSLKILFYCILKMTIPWYILEKQSREIIVKYSIRYIVKYACNIYIKKKNHISISNALGMLVYQNFTI